MHGEVVETIRLTPSLIRIVLGGDGLDGFETTSSTDQYVNALFVPDEAPYAVPFDLDVARTGPPEHRPVGRRYTIRSWDPETRRVAIDFVVHGDSGVAGPWAQRAEVGDLLQFIGPSGGYSPSEGADWHLMVGDESALPAIAASLERVRAGRPVEVVVIVDGPEHELPLPSPGDVTIRWIHRSSRPDHRGLLLEAVESLEFRDGEVDVFVHGEASEVRAVRRHLITDRGVPREGTSISPYWRRDFTDEAWRAVKAEFIAEMRDEA